LGFGRKKYEEKGSENDERADMSARFKSGDVSPHSKNGVGRTE
jgi:hypothetical protein